MKPTAHPNAARDKSAPGKAGDADPPYFATNTVRLNLRQWAFVGGVILAIVLATPCLWKHLERFDIGTDYRIPYDLSKDYWLYQRRMERLDNPEQVVVIGDSVVWGEFVLPDGTLPHFLDRETDATNRFVNGGVNGLFPLALEGLIRSYGGPIHDRKVILHCNLLWMSSPKADLQTAKEEKFNHPKLVPQFSPRIPCYRADANVRLSNVLERRVPFFGWTEHLQTAYFKQNSLIDWTLADDGGLPPKFPNTYKNPVSQITMVVPAAPEDDPLRGPASPRHKPWSTTGEGTSRFEWVDLDTSLQWGAFQRLVNLLRDRGNDIFVVVGPLNEHTMIPENRAAFHQLVDGVREWLDAGQVPNFAPDVLPSDLYGDTSHPLTEGYALLAKQLVEERRFKEWLEAGAESSP